MVLSGSILCYFAYKGPYSQSYGFCSSYVWIWELDNKKDWAPKNLYLQSVVLEKTFESLLDNKEIQPVNTKGNQSWMFIGRTDAEAEALIFWPPDAKSKLIWKDPDAGKDWRQKKRTTENEMVGRHHWLNGREFEQVPGNGEGQGSLVHGVAESRTKLSILTRVKWRQKFRETS